MTSAGRIVLEDVDQRGEGRPERRRRVLHPRALVRREVVADDEHVVAADAVGEAIGPVPRHRQRLDRERADAGGDARLEHAVDAGRHPGRDAVVARIAGELGVGLARLDAGGRQRAHPDRRPREAREPREMIPVGVGDEDVAHLRTRGFHRSTQGDHLVREDPGIDRDRVRAVDQQRRRAFPQGTLVPLHTRLESH